MNGVSSGRSEPQTLLCRRRGPPVRLTASLQLTLWLLPRYCALILDLARLPGQAWRAIARGAVTGPGVLSDLQQQNSTRLSS